VTRVTGTGVTQMQILAVKLKTADPKLKRNLRRRLRDTAGPVADKARRSILDMPAVRQAGLREEAAASVTTSVTMTAAGIRVTISSLGSRMPPGKHNLPAYLDEVSGWGHPVYANRKKSRSQWTWVHQTGKPGWFERPIAGSAKELRAACQRAIDDTARELT
jgi:hypothetical protein